jgi:hypothetical protein
MSSILLDGKSDYSLWLSPTANETVLSDLIIDLSRRVSPPAIPFSPHATLFSDSLIGPTRSLDEIVQKVQQAVDQAGVTRVICKFDSLEAGKLFYQCVYIKLCKNSSSEGLLELHRALRRTFEDKSDPEGQSYFPHVSLVYGDLDMEVKTKLIEDMKQKGEAQDVSSGEVKVADLTEYGSTEVLVVKTAGAADGWEIAARIPLGKRIAHEDL